MFDPVTIVEQARITARASITRYKKEMTISSSSAITMISIRTMVTGVTSNK